MADYLIGTMPEPLDDAILAALADVETATIGHVRHWGFMNREIKPLNHTNKVIGCAITLALPAQDSTLLHHATGMLRPGDIVVIDRLGDRTHACVGGAVATAVVASGALGCVIDGPATDPTEIKQFGLTVWCAGVSPITTRLYNLGGMLNQPISCGGVSVKPGDVILADENGVLVIPREEAIELGRAAVARQNRINGNIDKIRKGAKLGELSGATKMVLEAVKAAPGG